jgi:hypothetical protein
MQIYTNSTKAVTARRGSDNALYGRNTLNLSYVKTLMFHTATISAIYKQYFTYNCRYTVGYARTNVIGSITSFVIASVHFSIH